MQLVVLCILGKYLAVTIPVLAAVLLLLQRYYLSTSRQVRLIDIEIKAPLYKTFVETVAGASIIRSFRWNDTFHERYGELMNQAQRPFYMLLCIQQWLVLVLDLIVGALAVLIVAIAMSVTGKLSAGSTGVALVLVLDFNALLTQTIQSWTKLETSIGAVARVQDFVRNTPSERRSPQVPPPDWPQRGEIRFQHVVARYE